MNEPLSQNGLISLEGIELAVVGYDDPDYKHRLHIVTHSNGSVEFVEGMCYDLLLALQTSLQFRYRAVEGRTWWRLENGTVFGMAGQIHRGEANISIAQASMVMLMQAVNEISYLIPTSYNRLSVIFRQPRSTHDIIRSVFNYQIWICWILIWFSVASTLLVINYTFQRIELTNHKDNKKSPVIKKCFTEPILWCFSAMCCKGWYTHPTRAATRSVVIVGMIFAYLNSIFFSASLTCDLATETTPIKSFHDLVKSELEIFGDKRLPVVRDTIQRVYEKRKKKSYNPDDLQQHYIRIKDSLHKILKSGSAFMAFEDAAKSVSSKQGYSNTFFCDTVSDVFVTRDRFLNAMFVRKGSSLREPFNQNILKLIERGITFRLNVIYQRKTLVICPVVNENYRGGLGFEDLSLVYFIAVVGLSLCFLSILMEKIIFMKTNDISAVTLDDQ